APRRSRARRSGARRRAACRYRVAAWPFAGGARSHGRGAAGFGGDAASGRLRATGSDDPDAGAGGSRPARARRRAGDGGRTLGGCRVVPRRGGLLVCREAAAAAPPVPAPPGATVYWDGRFALYLPPTAPEGLLLGALGAAKVKAATPLPATARSDR